MFFFLFKNDFFFIFTTDSITVAIRRMNVKFLLLLKKNWLIKSRNTAGTIIQVFCPIIFFFIFLISGLINGKPPVLQERQITEITKVRPLQLISMIGKYPPTGPYLFGGEGFSVDMNNFYLLIGPNNYFTGNISMYMTQFFGVKLI